MKKLFIILPVALLSALLISQVTLKFSTLTSVINKEFVVDVSVNITDHSEEDFTVIDHKAIFQTIIKETLIKTDFSLSDNILPLIWQPPK